METIDIELYDYYPMPLTIDLNDLYLSSMKNFEYETLYNFFNEENITKEEDWDYFLTSYTTRHNLVEVHMDFYFRRQHKTAPLLEDTILLFGKYLQNDCFLLKYLKKYRRHRHSVIGIKKIERIIEDRTNIVFYITLKKEPFVEKPKPKPKLITIPDCCICLDNDKQTFKNSPYKCNHKNVCIECFNKLVNTKNECPLCRGKCKSGRNSTFNLVNI